MTMNPLLARFTNEPALVEPAHADRFIACLQAVAANENAELLLAGVDLAAADDDFWSHDPQSFLAYVRPYVVRDGILHIPVKGVLLHNFPYALGSWATGYEYIWRAYQRGTEDGAVRAIAFHIDSPGGMVAGCFETVDKIVASRTKPTRAFAHEGAYSAAYAIACAAEHITVSRTGGVGSVGVVTSHMDVSEAMSKAGLKITFIHAGKHKVDGNMYAPLSDDAKARIQSRIDEIYGVFVSCVARGRDMEEKAVRETEALCFTATESVSNGLADTIGSLDDAVAAFAAFLDDQSDNSGENAMADQVSESAVDQAAVDTARTEGQSTGRAEGASAERQRIAAILGSDEAKDRPALAQHLAMNTETSPEDAKALLAVAAKETVEAPAPVVPAADAGTGFDAAMGDGPAVGAGGGDGGTEASDDGSDVLALAASHGLKGFAKKPA